MKLIVNKVFGRIIGQNFNKSDCVLVNYTSQAINKNGPDKYEICFKQNDYLIIHSDVLEEIMKGSDYGKLESVRAQLFTGKYVRDEKTKPYSYPKLETQTKSQAQIRGLKFFYSDFKHLLSDADILALSTVEKEEVPGMPSAD